MARSAQKFDADSVAEVVGETDLEEDVEKAFMEREGTASFVVNTSGLLAFHCVYTYIYMRQDAMIASSR